MILFRRLFRWENKSTPYVGHVWHGAYTHGEKRLEYSDESNKRIQNLVLIALFAALTLMGTMIKIPLPTGAFLHFGNAVVLLAVLLIGYWQEP